ncbi:MAG: type IV secretory system conjugative DNA transfer family protein, partial [Bacteroidota bacterium]
VFVPRTPYELGLFTPERHALISYILSFDPDLVHRNNDMEWVVTEPSTGNNTSSRDPFRFFNRSLNAQEIFRQSVEANGCSEWTHTDTINLRQEYDKGGIFIGFGKAFKGEGHIATIAATRSGKGVKLIDNHLLNVSDYQGSQIILDIKGTLTAKTALAQKMHVSKSGARRKVYILDPWNTQGNYGSFHSIPSAQFNPLERLHSAYEDNPKTLWDEANAVVSLIALHDPNADKYWTNRAREILTAILVHLTIGLRSVTEMKKNKKTGGLEPKLKMVKEELSTRRLVEVLASPKKRRALLEDMLETDYYGDRVKSAAETMLYSLDRESTEFDSVYSTTRNCLEPFNSPLLDDMSVKNEFSIKDLCDRNNPVTVYICIPPKHLDTKSIWLKLIFGSTLSMINRHNTGKTNNKILFLLDEFPRLHRMPEVEEIFGLHASTGVTAWVIMQNLGSLQDTYTGKSWQSIIGNAAVKHYMDLENEEDRKFASANFGEVPYIRYKNTYVIAPTYETVRQVFTSNESIIENADYVTETGFRVSDNETVKRTKSSTSKFGNSQEQSWEDSFTNEHETSSSKSQTTEKEEKGQGSAKNSTNKTETSRTRRSNTKRTSERASFTEETAYTDADDRTYNSGKEQNRKQSSKQGIQKTTTQKKLDTLNFWDVDMKQEITKDEVRPLLPPSKLVNSVGVLYLSVKDGNKKIYMRGNARGFFEIDQIYPACPDPRRYEGEDTEILADYHACLETILGVLRDNQMKPKVGYNERELWSEIIYLFVLCDLDIWAGTKGFLDKIISTPKSCSFYSVEIDVSDPNSVILLTFYFYEDYHALAETVGYFKASLRGQKVDIARRSFLVNKQHQFG